MKKNAGRRILAMLLCVLMFVSLLPFSVFAEEDAGESEPQLEEVQSAGTPEESETPDEEVQSVETPEGPETPDEEVQSVETPEGPETPDETTETEEVAEEAAPAAGQTLPKVMGTVNGETALRGEAPASYTEVSVDDFPYTVSVGADETVWFRFTAPWTVMYYFSFGEGFALSLYDADMSQMYDEYVDNLGWVLLEKGVYYLALRSYQSGASTTTIELSLDNDFTIFNRNYYVYAEPQETVRLEIDSYFCHTLDRATFAWYDPDGALLATTREPFYDLVSADRTGEYACTVSDGFGSEETVVFHVYIENDVGFQIEYYYGVGLSLNPGEEATLAPVIVGSGDRTGLTFQWYKGDTDPECAISGAVGSSYTLIFDGQRTVYYCVMTDRYGNKDTAEFGIIRENHFALEPVLQDGWTYEYGTVSLSLPIGNNGVTLQVRAEGDDLTGVTYEWSGWKSDGIESVLSERLDTDTLVLGPITRRVYCSVWAEDRYGTSRNIEFSIGLNNRFSLNPVLGDGWTVDEMAGSASLALPMGNNGITLQVLASGDDLSMVTYSWDTDAETVLSERMDTDTLVLGPITRHTLCWVYAEDGYGNWKEYELFLSIDNGLTLTPRLEDGWGWDGKSEVQIVLPPENEGVTLRADVQVNDESGMTVVWQKCDQWDVYETVENATGYSLATGPLAKETFYELCVTDRFGTPALLRFHITINDGNVTPTSFTDLAPADFPYSLNFAAGQTAWFRFTAPWDTLYVIHTVSADVFAYALDFYDAEMQRINSRFYYENADGSGGGEIMQELEAGTYWLAVSCENGIPAELTLSVNNYLDAMIGGDPYRSAEPGGSVMLDGIYLEGTPLGELSYSWYGPDGVLLAKTDEPWYEITNVVNTGEYDCYTCVVSDGLSYDSTVFFYVRAEIYNDVWIHPVDQNNFKLLPGDKVTLEAMVEGSGDRTDLSFQWYKRVYTGDYENGYQAVDTEISGATGLSYTLTFDGKSADFFCRMTDRFGNTDDAFFYVRYQNHFSIEPVPTAGLTVDQNNNNRAFVVVPVENNGITLQIRAKGDDLRGVTYHWWGDEIGTEVIGEQDGDSLKLSRITRHVEFYVEVIDKYNNSETYIFAINLDNGLTLSPVPQDGWTVDNGNVRVVLPIANQGVTLQAIVQATDMSDMEIEWSKGGYYTGFELIGGANTLSLDTGAITEPIFYRLCVRDRYGNPAELMFEITLDNNLTVEVVSEPDWNVYHEDTPGFRYYSITVPLMKDNQGLTLQIRVNATDKSQLYVSAQNGLGNGTELQPDDSTAEVWTYTYAIPGPITEAGDIYLYVRDGYGGDYNVDYHLIFENNFRATASDGSYQAQIPVASGKTAKLELSISGDDLSKLSIYWIKINPKTDQAESIPAAQGKRTCTTPKITENTLFRAFVSDGYGSNTEIYFYVYVNNKLSISSKLGTEVPRGAIRARLVEVDAGGSVTLMVTAAASNATGLKINWYDQAPFRDWRTNEPNWGVPPIATTDGKTSSQAVSSVSAQKTLYAQAVDKFGNTAVMQFDVQVKNGLRAYVSGTTEDNVVIYAAPGEPLTLAVDVFAADKTGLTVQWSNEDGMLEPNDTPDPDGVYRYTIPSLNRTRYYTCNVIDRFNNRVPVSFRVIADNNLSIKPVGDRYTVALRAGETARLIAIIDPSDANEYQGKDNEVPIFVNADDKDGLTFAWLKASGRGLMSAGSDKVLTTEPMDPANGAMLYYLQVSDKYNNHASYMFHIELDNNLSAEIVGNTPVVVANGKKATLKVKATADDAAGLQYQWFNETDGSLIQGATKASYTTPAIKKQEHFSCRVTDRYGNQAWADAFVQVQNKLTVTRVSPYEQFVPFGGSATLEVEASAKSMQDLSYQWYLQVDYDSRLIVGATGPRYTVENVTAACEYFCQVTDRYGSTESVWFMVAPDNGFIAASSDGKTEYTVFKGLSKTLAVDIRLNDGTDYSSNWTIRHKDNDCVSWLPLFSSHNAWIEDGVWCAHDSWSRVWDEPGVYEVRYEGVDKTGAKREIFFTVEVLTISEFVPAAPTLALTPDGVAVTFETVPDVIAQHYVIQRRIGKAKFADVASFDNSPNASAELSWNGDGTVTWVDKSVKNNTKYSYCILVKNNEGGKSKAGLASETLAAYLPPVMKGAEQTVDGVKLSWQKVAGAGAYQVYRSVDGGEWGIVAPKASAVTYTDKTAVSGAENRYRVCVLDKKGNMISALPNESIGTFFLAAPVFTAQLGPDGLVISGERVPGAEYYQIERKIGKGEFEWFATLSASEDPFVFLEEARYLANKTTYAYRVTAIGAAGWKSLCNAAQSVTYYTAPTLTSAEATAAGVKLTWQKTAGAAAYRVWRSADDGEWEIVAKKVAKTTYTDVTAGYKMTNRYRVQALNKSGAAVSEGSKLLDVVNDLFLAAPSELAAAVDFGGVSVTWGEVKGAEGYWILRKIGAKGAWEKIGEVGAGVCSFSDVNVQNKTACSYTIQAVADGGTTLSKYDTKGKSVTYYEAPTILSVTAAAQGALVTWKKVDGAAKYRVMRWDEMAGEWIVIGKAVSGTSYTDKDAQPGWAYTVQALNKSGKPISAFDPIGVEFTA